MLATGDFCKKKVYVEEKNKESTSSICRHPTWGDVGVFNRFLVLLVFCSKKVKAVGL